MNKLNINEVFILNEELQNLNKEKDVSFVVKYHISKVMDKITTIMKRFNDSKIEVIKKYGKETEKDSGAYTLEGCKDFEKGVKEINELIKIEEDIDFEINMEDIKDLKTDFPYNQIFKFIK